MTSEILLFILAIATLNLICFGLEQNGMLWMSFLFKWRQIHGIASVPYVILTQAHVPQYVTYSLP
jgi:hypothetical protein